MRGKLEIGRSADLIQAWPRRILTYSGVPQDILKYFVSDILRKKKKKKKKKKNERDFTL